MPPAAVLAALPVLPRGLRPVPAGQHHVTLAFLGEVPDPAPVADGLDAALPGLSAPALRLASSGAFGSAVWLGVAGDLVALGTLAAAVRAAVGAPADARPSRPHLTVGRGRAALPPYEGPGAVWDRVDLVRSRLGPGGARHEALRTWRLQHRAEQ